MKTYAEADRYLGNKTERPIGSGRATRIHRDGNEIKIRYQKTDVVTYRQDGTVVLETGGWLTHTTKERIKEYSPAHPFSHNGLWYLPPKGFAWGHGLEGCSLFYDGVVVGPDGQPLEPRLPEQKPILKRKLDRQVLTYINGFLGHIKAQGLKDPDAGDCWGCFFTAQGAAEPLGIDHYLSHFEEGYYPSSLLANAVKAGGWANPGLIWHSIKYDCQTQRDSYLARQALKKWFRRLKPQLLGLVEMRAVGGGDAIPAQEG